MSEKGRGKGLPGLGRGSSKSGDSIEGAQELNALGATAEVAVGGVWQTHETERVQVSVSGI